MKDRIQQIRLASMIGIIGNLILAILKIAAGLISGSLAVIGDGIDTTTDVVTSFVTLITARIISKPPDAEHPYGHGRAETIATKILSFIIFFAGAQLAWSTALRLISRETVGVPTLSRNLCDAGFDCGESTARAVTDRYRQKNRQPDAHCER